MDWMPSDLDAGHRETRQFCIRVVSDRTSMLLSRDRGIHLKGWDTFAAITGGAAAALIGFLFVSVSINIDIFARVPELRTRASHVLIQFGTVLFISILIALPGQAYWMLGAELVIIALAVLYGQLTIRPMTDEPQVTLTVLLLLAAGIVLIFGLSAGLYVLVVPVLGAFGLGGYLAWMFLLAFRSGGSE
jgi:hypothetical protein